VKVRWIKPDEAIGAQRGQVVICIPVHAGHEHFVACLRSVLAHTSSDVPILVCDDASPDSRSQTLVERLADAGASDHDVLYLRRELNVGFPANVNGAFAICAPADVIVLNSDCVVAEGWVDGLRDAAYVDSRVATATALTNHGSIISVPAGAPTPALPADWSLDDAAAAVSGRSLRLRPRIPTAVGHCMFIRRSALDLVGDFDLAFSPGYGEEVDFSQRCLQSGLSHVVADDVLVFHHGGGSFANEGVRDPTQDRHERMLAARYPYYHDAIMLIEDDAVGPLRRVLSVARRSLAGLSVVIDGRILAGPMTGTQLHVLELTAALARTGKVRTSMIVPDHPSEYATVLLESLEVTLATRAGTMSRGFGRADLVHRPFQVNNVEDLSYLSQLGERLVVTNQDLIGYHNPAYFRSFGAWNGYRQLTRMALAVTDRVVFFSAHARDDALAEDLVERERASVVHIGVDHVLSRAGHVPVAPHAARRLPEGAPAILCIGTDFRHKNRVFAMRLLDQLQQRHDWPGYLLLVGPHVAAGSSASDEAEVLALHPHVASRVIDFAAVSEAEKEWLYNRVGLVVYPTVHEGFGLIPFEAADHGVPCLWSKGTSLSEVLPDSAGGIVPWDAGLSADAALELLRDSQARARNLEAIHAAAAKLTWDATAAEMLALYDATCDAPATPARAIGRRQGLMGGALSEDAMRLVGPGGALPSDVERPLLALATHPQIGAPMFRVMKFGYRASYRLRRQGRQNGR
jgi:GT2 family glycosyltransferase